MAISARMILEAIAVTGKKPSCKRVPPTPDVGQTQTIPIDYARECPSSSVHQDTSGTIRTMLRWYCCRLGWSLLACAHCSCISRPIHQLLEQPRGGFPGD